MPLFALLLACADSRLEIAAAPFACPAGTQLHTDVAVGFGERLTWSCRDGQGRLDGPWVREWEGRTELEGAYAAGKRHGRWRAHDVGYQLNDQQITWSAAGTYTDGVPTGDWTLEWATAIGGPGGTAARGRWSGSFVDGAPATTDTWDLARALASRDALPKEAVRLSVPLQTVGGSTLAPASHVCDGPQPAIVYSLGEDAPIVVDPYPLFAQGWRSSFVDNDAETPTGGPDRSFSRIQVDWKGAPPTGTLEMVTVFDTTATDERSVKACFLEPAPIARVLAWRVCGDATCGPWSGFWSAAMSDPGSPGDGAVP